MESSSWKIITKGVDRDDPVARSLFEEAQAAVPPGYVSTGVKYPLKMLPKEPLKGRCRLCGQEDDLTREHIPPKSSGNKERYKKYNLDEWLKRGFAHEEMNFDVEQGGIFGYTLCRKCNSLTGKLYGGEYKSWAERAESMITEFGPGTVAKLDSSVGPFGWKVVFGSKETGAVKPGAFVRQVLSCMCSLSGNWDLPERYPEIRRIILEQSVEQLPDSIELGMSLYLGPKMRIIGPCLKVDVKTRTWKWCQEIAFPPFAFLLVIASNKKKSGTGLMINEFTMLAPDKEQYFSGVAEVGFGWGPYPGDYRTRTAIEADR